MSKKFYFTLLKYLFLNYFIRHAKFHIHTFFIKRDIGLRSSLKYCDVTKNGEKTGFSPITHDMHVKIITARMIRYLGIITRLLRHHTIYSVQQLFSKLFFILNAVEQGAVLFCVFHIKKTFFAPLSRKFSWSKKTPFLSPKSFFRT